jgi:hypothetical protein
VRDHPQWLRVTGFVRQRCFELQPAGSEPDRLRAVVGCDTGNEERHARRAGRRHQPEDGESLPSLQGPLPGPLGPRRFTTWRREGPARWTVAPDRGTGRFRRGAPLGHGARSGAVRC